MHSAYYTYNVCSWRDRERNVEGMAVSALLLRSLRIVNDDGRIHEPIRTGTAAGCSDIARRRAVL